MAQDLGLLAVAARPHAAMAPHVPLSSVGQPFPGATARGLLTFRGNPTRTWHGTGPLPRHPRVLWRAGPYCGMSTDEAGTRQWCGTGWTGQPVVWDRGGRIEVIFGAYDHAVHTLDAATGADLRPPFRTGDLIKGSVSLDPTGAPLLYVGSRDNYLRILRLDDDGMVELWRQSAVASDGIWNNDWDASPLVLGNHLFAASENSWLYVFALNRGTAADGSATVAPELVNRIAGFTPELFRAIGDRMVSIENSPMAAGGLLWFANGAGLVQAHRLDGLVAGQPRERTVVYEYLTGDDTDATLIAGPDGAVYVAVQDERGPNAAKAATGQLARLDPQRPGEPPDWALPIPGRWNGKGGIWATPALYRGYLQVPTHVGGLLSVDAATGRVTQRLPLAPHGWSSPVVVGDAMLVGSCDGDLVAYSLADPARPREIWRFHPPDAGCWESTPAVWEGIIYLGNRNGYVYAIGDSAAPVVRLADFALQ